MNFAFLYFLGAQCFHIHISATSSNNGKCWSFMYLTLRFNFTYLLNKYMVFQEQTLRLSPTALEVWVWMAALVVLSGLPFSVMSFLVLKFLSCFVKGLEFSVKVLVLKLVALVLCGHIYWKKWNHAKSKAISNIILAGNSLRKYKMCMYLFAPI